MTPEEINKRSAIMETITRDLERAGLLSAGINRTELMNSLLDPNTESEDEKDFIRLQQLGDPDNRYQELDDREVVFGEDANIARAKMDGEFRGRGWVEGVDFKPGQRPAQMSLSPGGRQADEYRRRRDLIKGIREPGILQRVGQYIPDGLLSSEHSAPTSLDRYFDDPVKAFEAQRDRDYGTSGFTGAMENPEYTLGWYSNNFATPITNTYQYVRRDGMDLLSAAGSADDRRQALAIGKRVDPILPNVPGENYDRASREKLFAGLREMPDSMLPTTYDMKHRQDEGYYPGYPASKVTDFLENIPDVPTLVSTAIGFPVNPARTMSWVGRELLEEAPQYAAVAGGFQMAAGDDAAPTPWPKLYPGSPAAGWTSSEQAEFIKNKFGKDSTEFQQAKDNANAARTDLYVRDPDNPEKWRPETDQEFKKTAADHHARQFDSFREFRNTRSMMPSSPK
jgi:hypothetical protein